MWRTRAAAAAAAAVLVGSTATPGRGAEPAGTSYDAPTTARPAVIGTRLLGHSVRGRPITAWHLGRTGHGTTKVVLIATMHGNEPAPQHILQALRDGPPIHDLDLWVVPVYNPDGLAADTRHNADDVDLNRNYPYEWSDSDEGGPSPASEPETRAMMAFLSDVRPAYILSFHQPLDGVDTDSKSPPFARRVARALHLPQTSLNCGSSCHGTMTQWYDHEFPGVALTVEYGAHPGRRRMTQRAPGQVLSIFGADVYLTSEPSTP